MGFVRLISCDDHTFHHGEGHVSSGSRLVVRAMPAVNLIFVVYVKRKL